MFTDVLEEVSQVRPNSVINAVTGQVNSAGRPVTHPPAAISRSQETEMTDLLTMLHDERATLVRKLAGVDAAIFSVEWQRRTES